MKYVRGQPSRSLRRKRKPAYRRKTRCHGGEENATQAGGQRFAACQLPHWPPVRPRMHERQLPARRPSAPRRLKTISGLIRQAGANDVSPGAAIYRQNCAACHDNNEATRAPTRESLAKHELPRHELCPDRRKNEDSGRRTHRNTAIRAHQLPDGPRRKYVGGLGQEHDVRGRTWRRLRRQRCRQRR